MRKWQGSKWIRREKRLAIYQRDNFRCVYCQADLVDTGHIATLDHVHAVELGGTNHETNLVTACKTCNSSKKDHNLATFLGILEDRGQDPEQIRRRIRNSTRRKLRK